MYSPTKITDFMEKRMLVTKEISNFIEAFPLRVTLNIELNIAQTLRLFCVRAKQTKYSWLAGMYINHTRPNTIISRKGVLVQHYPWKYFVLKKPQ